MSHEVIPSYNCGIQFKTYLYSVQPKVLESPRCSSTHQTRGVVIYS